MPIKLKVLVLVTGIGTVLNLLVGSWIAAGIGVAVIAGLLYGGDLVRRAAIAINVALLVLTTVVAVALVAQLHSGLGTSHPVEAVSIGALVVVGYGVALAQTGFVVWCLTREDVRSHMARRDLRALAPDLDWQSTAE